MKKFLPFLFVSLTVIIITARASGAAPMLKDTTVNFVCADTHEYNDVQDSATAITPGILINGRIESEEDQDWYKFTMTTSGNIFVNVSGLPPTDEDPDEYMLELWSASGVKVHNNPYEFDLPNLHMYYYGAPAGTYYVRVYRSSWALNISQDCYQLIVGTEPSGLCAESYEPNNEIYNPPSIPFNTEILSVINTSADMDYYKFTSPDSTGFQVILRNPEAKYEIYLYSDSTDYFLELGLASTRDFEDSAVIYYNVAYSTTYHVLVTGKYGAALSSRCYSLIIRPWSGPWWETARTPATKNIVPDRTTRVYPVPSTGTLYMEVPGTESKLRLVTVSDMSGRIVYTKQFLTVPGFNRLEITMPPGQKNGIYIISDGEHSKKVILHR